MSPDFTFLLMLAVRMAVAAGFVVSASVIAERSGPAIGALVATLPISAGPSYVFLALDHDAAFIAQGALASLPINAATIVLSLTYVVLAQCHGALLSCSAAVAVWLALAVIIRSVPWTLAGWGDRQHHRLCDLYSAAAAVSPRQDAADHPPLV
jgi:hypothetical protein